MRITIYLDEEVNLAAREKGISPEAWIAEAIADKLGTECTPTESEE